MTEPLQMFARNTTRREPEQGFLLVGVIVMVALVLLFLSMAAPVVAKDLRREKELEAVNRGKQYTRAIRLYHLKFNSYPATLEALEKTNNIRYLRQRYVDPMSGKDDWRTIPLGQAKTTVKGFFGEPLAGLSTSGLGGGLGSAAGQASAQQPGGSSGPQSGLASSTNNGSPSGSSGTGTTGTDSGSNAFGTSSFGSSSSSSSNPLSGGSGPFVGVGIKKDGASIITLNEQTDYSTWEFIYDPRIEQLLAKVSLFGGGVASQSSGSLGSAQGLSSPSTSPTTPTTPTVPNSPVTTTPQ